MVSSTARARTGETLDPNPGLVLGRSTGVESQSIDGRHNKLVVGLLDVFPEHINTHPLNPTFTNKLAVEAMRQLQQSKTILLFGDQTDSWVYGLDQVYKQAAKTPWLKSYLADLTTALTTEIKAARLDRALQDSLGTFSTLLELGERYRNTSDDLGMANALLLHTVRSSTLLQWVKREPHIFEQDFDDRQAEWLGISGGLLSLAPRAVSQDFDGLCAASIEVGRLFVRLCKFTSVRSRASEDARGAWGWAVVGMAPDELRKRLQEFQHSVGIPPAKRAQIGVTGAGWSTVIGPPSVLDIVMKQCPVVKGLAKNPISGINALQHGLRLSPADLDFIVGSNSEFLDLPPCCPGMNLWGMDEPGTTYASWGEMLRAICDQVLSRSLDIPQAVGKLNAKLLEDGAKTVRVIQIGATSHAPYLLGSLKHPASGRQVSVHDANSLLEAPSPTSPSLPSGESGKIAIVGMAGRGPGCDNIDEFWDLILSKQDLCREVPKDRFDVDEYYCPHHGQGDKKCTMTTKFGCFMDKPGNFDARFFHISPREAMLMDPGHRQFLMSTYEALEMAGYSDGPTKATDPNRIAAFYGQVSDDWHDQSHPTLGCDAYTLQGVQRAFGPGRIAWQFKWEGPTYSLDSACASTTASIHLACMSLLSGDVDMAVAGAANILSYPHSFTCLSKAGVLSDTGNCKTYRDDADGYCRADFVGTVVLKRLEDAVAHNDNILGVVLSSGRNHSGNSTSITTSDAGAQERLFQKVLRNANVRPDEISYVEMHGTGTQVGDPAEINAVGNLFKHRRAANGPVPVGSVKANFGHSEAAAGMASLLKCLRMFGTDTVPPQAGMPHALNPRFPPLSELNIEIPSESKPFPKTQSSQPKRILLNNFDAAGGNACMLLEEYSHSLPSETDPRSSHVVVTSARTLAAHHANKRKLLEWLRSNPTVRIEDVAYTTTARRMHHPLRSACTASSTSELIAKLEDSIGAPDAKATSSSPPPVVFVFGGQGSQYAGMGSELYHTSPPFREKVDLCASICEEHGFPPFLHLLAESGDIQRATPVQTQLGVLVLELGLAALWASVGVQPSMVVGHSLGEYAALHVAGVLSLTDVLYLVGQRALLLVERCEVNAFAMLAVPMSATAAQEFLQSDSRRYSSCSVSCINSQTATVISGSTEQIGQLRTDLAGRGHAKSIQLEVPYGFHSFQMDSVLADYSTLAEGVTFSTPKVPVASTLLGAVVDTNGTFNSRYLGQQTRQAVDFVGALNSIKQKTKTDPIWLELGPKGVCTSFVRATLPPSSVESTLSTLAGPGPSWPSVTKCLAAMYMQGATVDWLSLHEPHKACLRMITLPSYSWDMKDYWITYTDKIENPEAMALPHSNASRPVQQMISTCAQYVVQESPSRPSSSKKARIEVSLGALVAEQGFQAVIGGHRMQREPICPGSAFCEAAFAAAAYALETNGRKEDAHITKLALRQPTMTRPLTKNLVGSDGGLLLTTAIMDSASSNEIRILWRATSSKGSGPSYSLGNCTLTVRTDNDVQLLQADWDRTSYFVKSRLDQVMQAAKEGCGHRFQPDIFYVLFAPTVEYSDQYKCVKEAYVSGDFSEAVAEVELRADPTGTRFTASPYWGESIVHLAGFAVNANPENHQGHASGSTSFINSGFESFDQTVPFEAGKTYYTYVRVSREDSGTRSCEVFVFDSGGRMVARCSRLEFHEINNATLQQVLSGGAKPAHHVPSPQPSSAGPTKVQASQVEATKTVAPKSLKSTETAGSEEEKMEQDEPTAQAASASDFEAMIQIIAMETGMKAAELTDDSTALADLGVDSIMAIEVAAKVSDATGQELTPSFVVDYPTIGDLRRAFAPSVASLPSSIPSSAPPSDPSESGSEPLEDSSSGTSRGSTPPPSFTKDEVKVVSAASTAAVIAAAVDEEDTSPSPSVRITLLQGRPAKKSEGGAVTPSFFMLADGTGSIATYIHLASSLASSKLKMPIYGIDSPFLRCPGRLTPQVGIPGAARLIVDALLKKQPHKDVPFWIGGFSGGAMVAYEVCRQLSAEHGRRVDGLLLIDMCAPRKVAAVPEDDGEVGLAMFDAVADSEENNGGVWSGTDTTRRHLGAMFSCVAAYNPTPLQKGEEPPAARTVIIWARKGLMGRCAGSARFRQILAERGINTEAYPGFMEDPKLGAVAWSLPHKTEADLGPNGWERYLGGREKLLCMDVDADHLEMPTPSHAGLLGEAVERAFRYFAGSLEG
ncbi:Non-reducing polyketide synthase rads2 [Podospora aff. communis PSN243]|uniref:Non-reducing polyketide synthase rads2 n=1 Tax=Podospora aff. communis PSN243 TaxID=3040156 RepID=A0AAV9GFM6_9PEZI|nr:Non-reducing polyketide synthase rads2 [Podospora aff. communis PSN243]